MSKVTDLTARLAEPLVLAAGCTLWDTEYVKEGGTWYLRVYIDKEGGVSIDDCERISRRLDPILDEEDPIPDSYVFEVGSAGADRVLKRPSDFKQFIGSMVEVSLYQPVNGSKSCVGSLAAYADGNVTILSGGRELTFNKQQIAKVHLHVSI